MKFVKVIITHPSSCSLDNSVFEKRISTEAILPINSILKHNEKIIGRINEIEYDIDNGNIIYVVNRDFRSYFYVNTEDAELNKMHNGLMISALKKIITIKAELKEMGFVEIAQILKGENNENP